LYHQLVNPLSAEQEAALEKAHAYTGFYDNMDECKISPEDIRCITMQDSTTPFLGEYAHDRSVWLISFHDINLKSKDSEPAESQFNRDFNVYIDSLTGYLLKITCFHGSTTPDECPELSAREAEKQLNDAHEQYVGFPDKIPEATFDKALNSGINPFSAKHILGQYVIYSDNNSQPRPVWIISFCGIPPINSLSHHSIDWIPLYQRVRIREIVDAATGKMFYKSTIPSVPTKAEDLKRIWGK